MGQKGVQTPARKLFSWVRRQSNKVKTFLAVVTSLSLVVTLRLLIHDHNHFFILAEFVHFVGIICLIYKLSTLKTCSGLSLKSQVLTAIFLSVRLFCSLVMEADIHTILDLVTLVATLWVIFMMKFKLKSSYTADLDTTAYWKLIVPCVVATTFAHPVTRHDILFRMLWALCVYLESLSMLPQLHLMQKVQIIEPFTSHYVFAMGIAKFFACAHWIVKIYDSGSFINYVGSGYLWIPMMIVAEIVQTFILADFCYYYIKSVMSGQLIVRIPTPV